jgi:hypothetical protein
MSVLLVVCNLEFYFKLILPLMMMQQVLQMGKKCMGLALKMLLENTIVS